MTAPRALTVREYAEQQGITLGTVYRRIWQGQVNATQVFGRWVIVGEQPKHDDPVAERVSA